jgi:hypothetical protein
MTLVPVPAVEPKRNVDNKFKSLYDHQMNPEIEYISSNCSTNSTSHGSYKDQSIPAPVMRVSVIKKMPAKKETSPFKNQRL